MKLDYSRGTIYHTKYIHLYDPRKTTDMKPLQQYDDCAPGYCRLSCTAAAPIAVAWNIICNTIALIRTAPATQSKALCTPGKTGTRQLQITAQPARLTPARRVYWTSGNRRGNVENHHCGDRDLTELFYV